MKQLPAYPEVTITIEKETVETILETLQEKGHEAATMYVSEYLQSQLVTAIDIVDDVQTRYGEEESTA